MYTCLLTWTLFWEPLSCKYCCLHMHQCPQWGHAYYFFWGSLAIGVCRECLFDWFHRTIHNISCSFIKPDMLDCSRFSLSQLNLVQVNIIIVVKEKWATLLELLEFNETCMLKRQCAKLKIFLLMSLHLLGSLVLSCFPSHFNTEILLNWEAAWYVLNGAPSLVVFP